jgi:hypothetical protein
MPEPVRYRNKVTQSGTGMLRYRTEMYDAEMLMPAASTWMPMPSYGNLLLTSEMDDINKGVANILLPAKIYIKNYEKEFILQSIK